MEYRFRHHYTVEEARALLPEVRLWLEQLRQRRNEAGKQEERLAKLLAPGQDVGGPAVSRWLRSLLRLQEQIRVFSEREVQIKDLDRGLVDFPALRDGREVFLCWEQDEDDIEFWHDLDSGYAGRERL